MEDFAQYILSEQDLIAKMEIEYYLSKKQKIFFDKTVVFKTEIARLFIDYMKLDVDKNLVLTASLLCNCKKVKNVQELAKVKGFAKEGADYLRSMGFEEKMCKICEQVNRYSGSMPREKESDILELVDQYGGMVLDREDRKGFKPDEAIVLLEYRNLKDKYNRYLETFITFIREMEEIELGKSPKVGAITKLVKIYNASSQDVKEFIRNMAHDYEPEIDKKIEEKRKSIQEEVLQKDKNPNRALFSAETTRKVMGHIVTQDKGTKVNED